MDVNFQNREVSCLSPALREIQNSEQTQEIKLTEGMPDVGGIVSAWGQPILRGKEWGADTLNYTGGMMVWVLYAPEDGSAEQCVEGWIPFQLRWDIPEELPEGQIRMRLLPRLVDARSVSREKYWFGQGWLSRRRPLFPRRFRCQSWKRPPMGWSCCGEPIRCG